jgi:hypothetical protein
MLCTLYLFISKNTSLSSLFRQREYLILSLSTRSLCECAPSEASLYIWWHFAAYHDVNGRANAAAILLLQGVERLVAWLI